MNDDDRVEILLTRLNEYVLTILDRVFQEYYNDIMALVPVEYRILITRNRMHRIVKGSRNVIHKLDPDIKQKIATEIRAVFEMTEDEYMRSVMRGKPDKRLGMVLQGMNQIHWNGI